LIINGLQINIIVARNDSLLWGKAPTQQARPSYSAINKNAAEHLPR
jgi:hypothetical protein